ncbi:hypothetical protein HYC85_008526 [Camellia sinensis]|uniref:Glucan endo-1,3-beta-D-glucosidase n=1 Tax=Camellia sinensis TaxID=4442 RepID=A0A7J7HS29_CAMSI|nr:hypothetical protein HYC85_008526 [Camellia sinensis]
MAKRCKGFLFWAGLVCLGFTQADTHTFTTHTQDQKTIVRVKIFDANPNILRAFANSDISVTVTVANSDIPAISKLSAAVSWVANNILHFYPTAKIPRIAVGNEVIATADKTLIAHLLFAMKSLHAALNLAEISSIQVSTPHSLGILSISDRVIFAPILEFHRQTNTPLMACPYPFFGFTLNTLDYALFKPNGGDFDHATGMNYTNMFDAQLDAIYSVMKRLGYDDVDGGGGGHTHTAHTKPSSLFSR